MARIALCSGTTTGPCVAVLDGDGAYAAPASHFIAPDNSGNVGDTWNGSAWSRVADPAADAVPGTEWRADTDADELHAVIAGVVAGRFDAFNRLLLGHSASVAAGGAALAQIHRESADPGLAIVGYGSTAASFPSLIMARSKGGIGTHTALDGSHVLGRISVLGAAAGDAWQESSRFEWVRESGGTVEGGDALASVLTLKMQIEGAAGLAEVMRWTPSRRVGVNVDPDATLHVDALDEADVALRVSAQTNPVLNVLGDGTTLLGALDRPTLGDGTPPLLNIAATGLGSRALISRFSADALGPSIVLAKSRATSAAWSTGTLAGDEVGSIDWRGADGSGPIELARLVGLSAEADSAAGSLVIELLKSGDAALSEVARITEAGDLGIGVDEPEARLHSRVVVTSETGIGVAAVLEAVVDVTDPMADDDPDVGHGVAVYMKAAKTGGGSVLASYLQTRGVNVTVDAEVHDLRIYTRSAGAAALAAEFGAGQIRAEVGSAALPSIAFRSSPTTGLFRPAADQLAVALGGAEAARFAATYLRPASDNALTLGQAALRWSTVFAATGTINTSDSREKVDLGPFPLGLDFVEALQPRWFRWADGSRHHSGVYAQDVAAALTAAGIDPATAGMWTLADAADPDSRQGLRMDQLIAPLIRAVQQLAARVAALEAA